MLRMARTAPIVEPMTATHVLNDARSAVGAGACTLCPWGGTPLTEATGERVAVGGTSQLNAPQSDRSARSMPLSRSTGYRWMPPRTFPGVVDRSRAGADRGGSLQECAARSW